MFSPFGAYIDWQATILATRGTWRYHRQDDDRPESTSLASSTARRSNEIHAAPNREIDKQQARLNRIKALQREDHLRKVRGVHFRNKSELLLLQDDSPASASESGTLDSQRSSSITKLSSSTPQSSVYTVDDEALLFEPPTTGGNHLDATSSVFTYVDRFRSWLRDGASDLWDQQVPKQGYLEPCCIVVSIIEPFPQRLRSLDVPCPSSVASYKQSSYFPETDTFILPDAAGGPFEIAAAEVKLGRWAEVSPEKFWKFRESALKELREMGKLHWRKMDRWGKGWQEGWWRGEERPVWDVDCKKWRCEVVRC